MGLEPIPPASPRPAKAEPSGLSVVDLDPGWRQFPRASTWRRGDAGAGAQGSKRMSSLIPAMPDMPTSASMLNRLIFPRMRSEMRG